MKINVLKAYGKNACVGLLALFIYFTFSSFQLLFLDLLHIDYEGLSMAWKVAYLILGDIVEMCMIILLFYKPLKKALQDLKQNHKKYFDTYFKYWLIIIGVMMLSNVAISFFTESTTSGNEESFRNLLGANPFYAYFSGVIFAPIIEELVFRKSLRNIIPNDTLFILVSGLVFGGLHIVAGYSGPVDLLYLIPYCTPGLIFAYILTKTDNVLVPASIHFMHNGILISMQIFAYLYFT